MHFAKPMISTTILLCCMTPIEAFFYVAHFICDTILHIFPKHAVFTHQIVIQTNFIDFLRTHNKV